MFLIVVLMQLSPTYVIVATIVSIGDGLAEPVGITFGRHKYETRSLTGGRLYTRSLEGSSAVFFVALAAVWAFRNDFCTTNQALVASATLPALATLAEAVSPHTWDSVFLLLTNGAVLMLITRIMPCPEDDRESSEGLHQQTAARCVVAGLAGFFAVLAGIYAYLVSKRHEVTIPRRPLSLWDFLLPRSRLLVPILSRTNHHM